MWTIDGKEFGSNTGKKFNIVKVPYDDKSFGDSFRVHLAKKQQKYLGIMRLWLKMLQD